MRGKNTARLLIPPFHEAGQFPSPATMTALRRKLLRWFESHGRSFPWRRASATNYQYIIAEALLQRTRAETVALFFPRFTKEFPSWRQLAFASVIRLQNYLKPIGLWRRRASSIRALAKTMAKRNGRFPRERTAIEALPGVGQYIANAVLLFCHAQPQPLLDFNMARVLERVFGPRKLADIRYDPWLQELARKVVRCKAPARLNWAILDLAATTCLASNPRCSECPLASLCKFAQGYPEKLPGQPKSRHSA